MNKKASLFFLLLFLSSPLWAKTFRFVRYPAPSPHGKTIAFTYQGDIWIVSAKGGRALRLTIHPGRDWAPRFSPDGKWIAFNSRRHGQDDLYVMTSSGEKLRRLTYYSGSDVLRSWTRDSKSLIFSSRREESHLGAILYKISIQGGTPKIFWKIRSKRLSLAHRGDKLASVIGLGRSYRKRYRGSGNNDIYIYQKKTPSSLFLLLRTRFQGRDDYPMWGGKDNLLYFISNRNGTNNLWALELKTKKISKLTSLKKNGVRYSSISADGTLIALEVGLDVWLYHTDTKKMTTLPIKGPDDRRSDGVVRKTYSAGAQSWSLSPKGKTLAFSVRGELFALDSKRGGRAHRLLSSPYREKDLVYSPSGKRLFFVSNRKGVGQIYSIRPLGKRGFVKALQFKITRWTSLKNPCSNLLPSPDGKKLAFVYGRGDLVVLDLKTKNARLVNKGFDSPQFSWSPDSRWIVLSRNDNEYNSDVWIVSAQGKTKGKLALPFNISQHPDNDFSPLWSPNGRFIAFVSRRNNNDNDIWLAYLRQEDYENTRDEWLEYFQRPPIKKKKTPPKREKLAGVEYQKVVHKYWTCVMHPQVLLPQKGKCPICMMDLVQKNKIDFKIVPKKKSNQPQKPKLQIEFKGLPLRLRQLTTFKGEECLLSFSPDSKTVLFYSNTDKKRDLYSVRVDGSQLARLTNRNTRPQRAVFASKDKIYFQALGGTFFTLSLKSKKVTPLKFKATVNISRNRERFYVFYEAWSVLNQNFYDPHFHGVDWKKIYKKYSRWIPYASSEDDFYGVIRLMLGELNSSHVGIYGPRSKIDEVTGMLGVKFRMENKGVRVISVIPHTPADHAKSRLYKGDLILKINQKNILPQKNFYRLFANTAGKKVLLTIERKKKLIHLPIGPTNPQAIQYALYRGWVEKNRAFVEKKSKGQLGYVHIRGMGWANVEQFERELYSAAHGKKGLIIDVRYNGGGWTTDYLLTILMVKRHAFTIPRNGGKGYPQSRLPYYAWTKGAVTLCNEYSFSNAEIFSHAFKNLKRGKLIGRTTYGGVISTGGTRLVDGSFLRIPMRGWYVSSTGKNMEHGGAVPDIAIENLPGWELAGKDLQLQKAVAVLSQTKKSKIK